jgi:hypothetical protein
LNTPFFLPTFISFVRIIMNEVQSILLPTAYLPPIEYFVRIVQSQSINIEQEENYLKQTYRNRCEIYSSNGKLSLSIPVKKTFGNHTRVRDIKIENSDKWQLNHWRAIVSAYNHSPYFLFYQDELKEFFFRNVESLLDFNTKLLEVILKLMKIKRNLVFTSSYNKTPPDQCIDFRSSLKPKDSQLINLKEYSQVFSERYGFLSNLSILDLLFNIGPQSSEYLHSIDL